MNEFLVLTMFSEVIDVFILFVKKLVNTLMDFSVRVAQISQKIVLIQVHETLQITARGSVIISMMRLVVHV